MDNLIHFRRAEAQARKAVKEAKIESFRHFCGGFTRNTPTSVIWRRVRQLSNKSQNRAQVPFIHQDSIIAEPFDKASLLASHYEEVYKKVSPMVNIQGLLLQVTSALVDDSPEEYNSRT